MRSFRRLLIFALIALMALWAFQLTLKRIYPLAHADTVANYSDQYGIDPYLAFSVIHAESRFQADAVSAKQAKGLMQLREDTAAWCARQMGLEGFDPRGLYEPETNIRLGIWYLSYLAGVFEGDMELTLASYNAGMGNVKKWLENPEYSDDARRLKRIPYPETDRYIKKVMNNYTIYKMLYQKRSEGKWN